MNPPRLFPLVLLAAGMLTLLAACGALNGDPLSGSSWSLVDLNGRPVLPGTSVTASFTEGQVSGSSGCNSYGGAYEVNGDQIKISDLNMTLMACMDAGVMDQESAFLGALGSSGSFQLSDGRLKIFTSDGRTLTFMPGAPK